MSTSGAPVVSVIIPVFNDPVRLARCLESLEHQQEGTPPYEVLVVDNGSDVAHDIAGVVTRFAHAECLHEAKVGSYAARNTGLRRARASIIAFTDSDCLPASNWIANGARHLAADATLGLVGGRIDLTYRNPSRRNAVELFETVMAFQQRVWIEQEHYGATANVFTTRAVVDAVGPFDEDLKSGGDMNWGRRVASAGFRQHYADDVVVRHPARHTFASLYQRSVRHAGGHYTLRCERVRGFLPRQAAFVRELAGNLVPPVMFAMSLRGHPQLDGWRQELTVAGVFTLVRYISAWELVRLKCGGAPARE